MKVFVLDQDIETLFGDGYRDPARDVQRLAVYTVMVAGLIIGIVLVAHGGYELCRPTAKVSDVYVAALESVVGLLMGGATSLFLAKESKRWELQHLTAERFVAGGFMQAAAFFVLGCEIIQNSQGNAAAAATPVLYCWAIGGSLFMFFLATGLVFAYAPKLHRRKRLSAVCVESRFAIDERQMVVDDPICPFEDHLLPVVKLRLSDGSRKAFLPSATAYDLAEPGMLGVAVVKGNALVEFHPHPR